MKIKITTIDLEIPHRTKRLALMLGIPALVIGGSAIAIASVPNTFKDGDVLSADKMNQNFADLDSRITAQQAKGWSALYAEQDKVVDATGLGAWVDVPGAAVTFTADTGSTVDLQAAGVFISSAVGTVDQFVRCAARFVIDVDPQGDPVSGQINTFVGVQTPANMVQNGGTTAPFTLMHRAQVAPGSHTIRLQIVRLAPDSLPASQGCNLNTWARVRATVMPGT